jgi:hypothetical protein
MFSTVAFQSKLKSGKRKRKRRRNKRQGKGNQRGRANPEERDYRERMKNGEAIKNIKRICSSENEMKGIVTGC